MKIKLPDIVDVIASQYCPNRFILKIAGKAGWDILELLANYNCMNVISFAKHCNAGVYCDHVMLDTNNVEI